MNRRSLRTLAERVLAVNTLPGIPEELSRAALELCSLIVSECNVCDECSEETRAEIQKLDVGNHWLVGGTADGREILVLGSGMRLPRLEALLVAAWIVACVGDLDAFDLILERVQSS